MENPLYKLKLYFQVEILLRNKTLNENILFLTMFFFNKRYGMFLFYMILFSVFVFQFCDAAKVVIMHMSI